MCLPETVRNCNSNVGLEYLLRSIEDVLVPPEPFAQLQVKICAPDEVSPAKLQPEQEPPKPPLEFEFQSMILFRILARETILPFPKDKVATTVADTIT